MSARALALCLTLVVCMAGALGAATAEAADAPTLAGALSPGSSLVSGASFVTISPSGSPNAVLTRRAVGFPRKGGGSQYAVISTGNAANMFGGFGLNLSTDLGGSNVMGNTDFDVTILKIDLVVPTGANCLSFDVRMLSEEFPEWPGVIYNDGFIAELDINDWTTVDSRVIAPHNFAFRSNAPGSNGQPLDVRTTGDTSANRANAGSTRYDGATPLLRAITPVAPGAHSLYLSLFDQGDHIYDSAVFLDRLRAYATKKLACPMGGFPIVKPVITQSASTAGAGGTRTFRARVKSESAISKITVRLDGKLIYRRTNIPNDNRDISLRIPVDFAGLDYGSHTITYRAVNRAGKTVSSRTIRRAPAAGLTGRN